MIQHDNEKPYQKYKIPPDFSLAQLHSRSCKLYQIIPTQQSFPYQNSNRRCGCCNQYIGTKKISMCSYVSQLKKIGEQVPLFFNSITHMILLVLVIIFIKSGQLLFFCNTTTCTYITFTTNQIFNIQIKIPLGFMYNYSNTTQQIDMLFMIQIIIYSIIIILIKINLKIKKYKYRLFNQLIQKRSIQLINLPKNCTEKQIKALFQKSTIQNISFTFKIKQFQDCMNYVAKLKNNLKILKNKVMKSKQTEIQKLQHQIKQNIKKLQHILQHIQDKQKRLSIAFVVFRSIQSRNRALKHYTYSLPIKLVLKLFPCCSKSSIHNQHVTIQPAMAPDDIKWQNLQKPYLQTKAKRVLSFIACTIFLAFGFTSQVILFNINNDMQTISGILVQLISSIAIFIINFLLINFLQRSTHKIQSRSSNTKIKLSLIRKTTFFIFINLSISPFFIILYKRVFQHDNPKQLLDNITLTILILSIGNCFKIFYPILSIQRFAHWLKCKKQKLKNRKCQLNQLQANKLFQPMQFPIQLYQSVLHSSLMMSFFYLGCFQCIIAIQLPSLVILYLSAKWMLLRVCKQPRGLSLKLHNLAQSLMRFYVPLYWLGSHSIAVVTSQQSVQINQFLQNIVYKNPYQIITTCIVILMLFIQIFVANIAMKITPQKKNNQSQPLYQEINPNRTYQQANLFYQINSEDLIKKNNRFTYRQHQQL